jgi:hypothetical protein
MGALETRMADVVDKATRDDPKMLPKRIAELERQMQGVGLVGDEVTRLTAENRDLRAQLAEALAREPERVPVLSADDLAALKTAIDALYDQVCG